ASATAPVPRFQDPSRLCSGQNCFNATPAVGTAGSSLQIQITSQAGQDLRGAQVLLRSAGASDIAGRSLTNPQTYSIAGTFDLTGAPAGLRDLVITPRSGPAITFSSGFLVVGGSSCTFSVSPQSFAFSSSGGSGSLILVNPAGCTSTPSSTVTWIT